MTKAKLIRCFKNTVATVKANQNEQSLLWERYAVQAGPTVWLVGLRWPATQGPRFMWKPEPTLVATFDQSEQKLRFHLLNGKLVLFWGSDGPRQNCAAWLKKLMPTALHTDVANFQSIFYLLERK